MARTSARRATAASLSSAARARVALPDGGVHDGEGLRDAQVVVHGLGEGGRHLGGGLDDAPGLLDDALHEALDPGERRLGLAQGLLAVLDHRAVVRGAEVVAQHDRAPGA